MAAIVLTNVRKTYGGVSVVHGIDLVVEDGEFVVVVGPSGCGKSTLLRMIAGLEDVTEGEIVIADRCVNALEPKDRDIAMVFQNYALYPHMTVRQNLAYGLQMRRMPRAEIDERIKWAAELLHLDDLLARRPAQLSGGQRQRVAMGRAMVRRPAAFLFDEPLSNLDARMRVRMRMEIKRLQSRLGTTSLYVTHDQVEAMTMADRLVVMNGGIVEQEGTPEAIYCSPRTMFVGGFIGSPGMNFLRGSIDGGRFVPGEGVFLTLPPQCGGQGEGWEGQAVVYGIRPEHVSLSDDGRAPSAWLEVAAVEMLGFDGLLHGALQGCGQAFSVRLREARQFGSGEVVPLAFSSDHAHLFDQETGVRIGSMPETATKITRCETAKPERIFASPLGACSAISKKSRKGEIKGDLRPKSTISSFFKEF